MPPTSPRAAYAYIIYTGDDREKIGDYRSHCLYSVRWAANGDEREARFQVEYLRGWISRLDEQLLRVSRDRLSTLAS